ncbi:MAG: UPF0175 family protein [Chloroflexota bacterium]
MSHTISQQLNVRVSNDLVTALEDIARQEHLDRGAVVRRLLIDGVHRWQLERAIVLYREDRLTKERAAEMADVSLYEFIELVRERNIPLHLNVDEALEEVKALIRRYSPPPKVVEATA